MTTNTNMGLHKPKTRFFAIGLTALSALTFLGFNNTYAEKLEVPIVECTQPYALCARAKCFTMDDVAYCKCVVKKEGKSASLPFYYKEHKESGRKNVCDLMAEGTSNGFMVSTFSLPIEVQTGKEAIYVCPNLRGTKAVQCDGGICLTSTINSKFPGLGKFSPEEILCSCPYGDAAPAFEKTYWHSGGPISCTKEEWKQICAPQPRLNKYSTGKTIRVSGPPTISKKMLKKLYGATALDGVKFCGPNGIFSESLK